MNDDNQALAGLAIIRAAMKAQGVNRADQLRQFCTPRKCFQAAGHDGPCDEDLAG
jgi:hypothetical protein